MTLEDIYLLGPEISLIVLAISIILLGLMVSRVRLLTVITLIGLLIPLGISISLWIKLGTIESQQIIGIFDSFVVDRFSLFFKFILIGVTGLIVLASFKPSINLKPYRAEYIFLILISTCGMMLLSSTIELISIYISLELSAIPIIALVTISKSKHSIEAGMKLFILSAVSSAIFLYGVVFIYGFTGTTYLTIIAERISQSGLSLDHPFGSYAILIGALLIISGLGFKIASVPFQMWVPDVYEGAPTSITAFLSVASKAAGFAILIRILHVAFPTELLSYDWSHLVVILSVLSMCVGNILAITQNNIKRMLAFSTIAHAGYILIGLAAISETSQPFLIGTGGILFYIVAYTATNLTAFFSVIAISGKIGSYNISDYGGIVRKAPLLAIPLGISMISLLGLPPTAGFMAKLYIFGAAIEADMTWLVLIALVNSVVSGYYYLRVVKKVFLSKPISEGNIVSPRSLSISLLIVSVTVLFLGIFPAPVIELAQMAANNFPP